VDIDSEHEAVVWLRVTPPDEELVLGRGVMVEVLDPFVAVLAMTRSIPEPMRTATTTTTIATLL
jgi:hypothetical protein